MNQRTLVSALAGAVLVCAAATYAQPPVPITYDTYLEAEISTNVEVDRYVFSGIAGEHISLRVNSFGNTSFDMKVELYDPSGTLDSTRKDTDWHSPIEQVRFIDYELTATGTYTVYISESGADATSAYWLSLQCREHVLANAKTIAHDCYIPDDSISQRGEIHAYTFNATEDEHVTLRVNSYGNTSFDLMVELYNPSGTLDSARNDTRWHSPIEHVAFVDYQIPSTGAYTVYVRECGGDATSHYWLSLQSLEDVLAHAMPVVLDSTYTDSIAPKCDQDAFSFVGAAGDRVSVRFKPSSSISSVMVISAPNGSVIYNDTVSNGSLNSLENYQLPLSGTYTARLLDKVAKPSHYTFAVFGMMLGHDAIAGEVIVPDSVVQTDAEIQPAAVVRNFGMGRDTIEAYFRIDDTYLDSATVVLNSYQSDTITFATWTAPSDSVTRTAVCSVAVGGETHLANNVITETFSVLRLHDGAAVAIAAPAETVLPESGLAPTAVVRNDGLAEDTIRVFFRIGSDYVDSSTVVLSSGESDTVAFDTWTPSTGDGTLTAICSVGVNGDTYPANDTVSKELIVLSSPVILENITMDPPSPDTLDTSEVVTVEFDYLSAIDSVRVSCIPYCGDGPAIDFTYARPFYPSGSGSGATIFSINSSSATVDSVRLLAMTEDLSDTVYSVFVPVDYTITLPVRIDSFTLTPSSPDTVVHGEAISIDFRYSTTADSIVVFCAPVSGGDLTPACTLMTSSVLSNGVGSGTAAFAIDSGNVLIDTLVLFATLASDTTTYLYVDILPVRFVVRGETGVTPPALRDLPVDYALRLTGGAALVALPRNASRVRVRAYDAAGRCVAVLHDGAMGAGYHRLRWAAVPGTYVVRMTTEEKALVRSMTVLR